MTKHVSTQVIRQLAQATEAAGEDAVARALQAVIEKVPLGESSRDDKLYDFSNGLQARRGEIMELHGIKYRRHLNGGGWVPVDQNKDDPNKPFVSAEAHVGPFARIDGDSVIKIYGGEFYNGRFDGGMYLGGIFLGGYFHRGAFHNGQFLGGCFYGGKFLGGCFYNGNFWHGVFNTGVFKKLDATYAEPGKKYLSDADADNT